MKLSIIIPIYNAEDKLPIMIKSVLAQTFDDWECILIDDGSSDSSSSICEECANNDSRFKFFRQENRGVSSARNFGLDEAEGEWLLFCDADDSLPVDALETYVTMLADNTEMVMGGYSVCDDEGNVKRKADCIVDEKIDRLRALTEMYVPTHFAYQGYIWCKLFKTAIVKQYGVRFVPEIVFNEDRLFVVDYLSHIIGNVSYSTRSVYNYYEHSAGTMASLRIGYNRKYVTDFEAYILMKKIICMLPEAKWLLPLADEGIIKSYDWNHQMMYKFNDYDSRCHWRMVWGMIRAGVFLAYLKKLVIPIVMFVFPRYFCRRK